MNYIYQNQIFLFDGFMLLAISFLYFIVCSTFWNEYFIFSIVSCFISLNINTVFWKLKKYTCLIWMLHMLFLKPFCLKCNLFKKKSVNNKNLYTLINKQKVHILWFCHLFLRCLWTRVANVLMLLCQMFVLTCVAFYWLKSGNYAVNYTILLQVLYV